MMKSFLLLGIGTAVAGVCAALTACGSESSGIDLTAASDASSEGGPSNTTTSGGPGSGNDGGVGAEGGIDPPGAGPGGDTKSIACGATTCPIPSEACCVSELAAGGNNSFACVVGGTCPRPAGGGVTAALACSGAANCSAGTICCVSDNNGAAASACKPSCGKNEAQLCDPKAGDAGGCTPAAPCSNDNISDWGKLPDTYATCGGQGT